ncbi:spore germination protein [Paenibacillus sp. EZ-K15]|uniref:spore germination protein n=1 Tax=Paenibacillus sp. EZ-K15 TaxID=2044275 RepID=UPI001F388AB8|nr:spore germination protein [Paenibacillus sp. EZ-K15]
MKQKLKSIFLVSHEHSEDGQTHENQQDPNPQEEVRLTLQHIIDQFDNAADFVHKTYHNERLHVLYFSHLVNEDRLERDLLPPLLNSATPLEPLTQQSQYEHVTDTKKCVESILDGMALFFYEDKAYLIDVIFPISRTVAESETESIIIGPHEAFTEQAYTNLSLIRKRVQSSHLKVIKLSVGEVTKSDVYVLYIQDIANENYVKEVIKRIKDIEIDAIHDTNMLIQCIDDDPYSIFAQFLTTERPDTIASKLVSGRIVGIMDGSPTAFSAPVNFFEFFSSSDDYYQRWSIGTATLFLRFAALIITVTLTALYVSVTSFHYEMIPENLILTLTESRSKVPFPPIFEALLMETTIELLREAGARLPTKIGQTIGIVGGIVIGQAAVQAGLTSNILIIAVASSAIASFVIPNYVMSASFRLFRFGLIVMAGLWGNLGLALGLAYIVIHLSGLTSVGASYLSPIAPFEPYDWKDVFMRLPFSALAKRPTQVKARNKVKLKMKR